MKPAVLFLFCSYCTDYLFLTQVNVADARVGAALVNTAVVTARHRRPLRRRQALHQAAHRPAQALALARQETTPHHTPDPLLPSRGAARGEQTDLIATDHFTAVYVVLKSSIVMFM